MNKRPRLSVFKSNKHIYGQIIDDKKGVTLTAVSDKDLKKPKTKNQTFVPSSGRGRLKTKVERAFAVGEILAERALKLGIKKIRFDRRNYKYHGRVKSLAEGVRKGGLKF